MISYYTKYVLYDIAMHDLIEFERFYVGGVKSGLRAKVMHSARKYVKYNVNKQNKRLRNINM